MVEGGGCDVCEHHEKKGCDKSKKWARRMK